MFTLLVSARADGIVSGDGQSALEAVLTNSLTDGGLITFTTNGTYQLTNFIVATDTMIDGTGFNVTITANNFNRIFTITNNVTLTLTNVTLTGGKTNQGGAIYNGGGTLICSNVIFIGNTATNKAGTPGTAGSGGHIAGGSGGNGGAAFGGGIYNNQGPMTLVYCKFTNNVATAGNGGNGGNGFNGLGGDGGSGGAGGPASGGAIYNNGIAAKTKIIGCFFVKNGALPGSGGLGGTGGTGSIPGTYGTGGSGSIGLGGAIYSSVSATLNITNTTFSDNAALGGNTAPQGFASNGTSQNGQPGGSAYGGAIDSVGFLNLENCTFYHNVCFGGSGAAIIHDGAALAGSGGNVGGAGIANTGIFTARNCTIATNDAVAGTNGVNLANSAKNGSMGLVVGGNLYRGGTTSTTTLYNTILQHGIGPDSSSAVVDKGFNISSDTSCAFTTNFHSLSKTNASLTNVLVFYTNLTVTCAPVLAINPGSIAQDFVTTTNGAPIIDERGVSRTNSLPDAGAFEIEPIAPIITDQPDDLALGTNKSGIFKVVAAGALPLGYQWYFLPESNSPPVPIVRGTNAALTVTNRSSADLGSYFVTVTNFLGSTNSRSALLQNVSPLTISNQPVSLKLGVHADADFTVVVGGPVQAYQWYFNTKPLSDTSDSSITNGIISGSDTAQLHISSITSSNAGTYKVVITNSLFSVTSSNATLTVIDPGITNQPVSQTINEHAPVTFTVGVFGSDTNFTFIWKKIRSGVTSVISNATNGPAYTIPSVTFTNEGIYFVVVTNSKGSATSETNVTLTVRAASSQITGHVLMGTNPVKGASVFAGSARYTTTSNGVFIISGLTSNNLALVPDQTFMTILPTNLVVTTLTGSNTVTNIVFQAFPTIRPAIPKPTNDVLPFLIGGGGGQTLAVQYSFLLTSNSWANLTNVVIPSSTNSTTLVVSNVSAAPYIFLRVGTP